MTESPRPKIPSILRKSNAKADEMLAPSDTLDSQESPFQGKSQENELSDDITVSGMGAKSSAIKKFNKTGVKNQPAKDNSAGLKKSTVNTLNGKEFKAAKKTAGTVKGDMEDDIEDVGEEKKENVKGGHKKGKKSADVDAESEEKQVESDDEEGVKKGNRKVKVAPSKNAKGTAKGKNEEKKESSPEKKSSKKEEVEEDMEEEAPKKELPKPKGKGKTLLGVKGDKENAVEKKSKEKAEQEKEEKKEKEKEKEKSKEKGKEREKSKEKEKDDEEEEETKTKDGGSKLDPLKREKKKLLNLTLNKPADKSTDKDKDKGKDKVKEKDKKSDKKDAGKKEASSKKDKKDTDKKDKKDKKKEKKPKKEKKKAEDPEEDEAADDDEEDEDLNESQLSGLLEDDEEDEDDFSGDERDIMIYARGADEDSDDIPKEEVNEDGEMQMISNKGGRSPVVDTYWKKNLRKSKGSSAKRKASEISNPHVYDAERILKMAKTSKKVIMYSGLEADDLDTLEIAVAKLPGFILNPTAEPIMTHLIYNGTKRTMKLLFAIAKRAWILAPLFFYSSLEFGDWVPEKDCEFAGVKSKSFRDTYGPLFKDIRFYFNHGDLEYFQTINIEELKKLVKLAGGKLTEKPEEAEVIIEDADNRKNSLAPKKFEGNQPHVISYKWILDSLMQYTKLKYQDFDILM